MRFGIDFGTTRTVIAAVDRGNYPVVNVADHYGDPEEYIPTVVALDSAGKIRVGWEALYADSPTLIRSFKRLLSGGQVNSQTPVDCGDETRSLGDILQAYAHAVVRCLLAFQHQQADYSTPEVVLGVPANAPSAQRLLTVDAFRSAGVEVIGLVNEPSAAAFEYTHRHAGTLNSKRRSIIVYDLGGGTFDVSLLRIHGHHHEVVASRGISRLGGDDFDEVLAELTLKAAHRDEDAFGRGARRRLLDEVRSAKEALKPQSKRLVMELNDEDIIIPVDTFYHAITPLIEQSLEATQPLVGAESSLVDTDIAGIYLVGGATALPLVPRMLRERYGRRVHRSPLPTASTAVGLAIAADPSSEYLLSDRRSRGIGVFREMDAGQAVSFDPLLAPGSAQGGTHITRRYRAAHNIGWFRYVEYVNIDESYAPGDLALLTEVLVPFDPALRRSDVHLSQEQLRDIPVTRTGPGPLVEETLSIDNDGIAQIKIVLPEENWSMDLSAH
ncbi:Hsp70 family protein [Corynebacterium poyangense]|uniref:Hsp70 family protein n=1 Tax=Corynebacterium poyangense TaxID=2684405 RepID=A0A7H0SQH0_9CORY|nr:Hsp70 family protein [Corynebacterium poyangense]MBZ8178319.1 Hsp70 family protein [Corynebacterium poyangense]QNQ90795.1 Hsp70 family protein [Corynebacterium poyangense]